MDLSMPGFTLVLATSMRVPHLLDPRRLAATLHVCGEPFEKTKAMLG